MMRNKLNSQYEKYQDELLLHSMSNYVFQIEKILEVLCPSAISEIGVEGGRFSKYLLKYAEENAIEYIGVEPMPSNEVEQLIESYEQTLIKYKSLDEKSTKALMCDVVFIDGDHNYYTVYNELSKIRDLNSNSVIFLHDVGWPCGRRDQYYDPKSIDEQYLHPFTFDGGLVPGKSEPQEIGFTGLGNYAFAVKEGGSKNGVSEAIEDFLKEYPNIKYLELLAIFGMGIIYNENSLSERQKEYFVFLEKSLALWNPLFVNMEENRIELLIELWKQNKVIENQNKVIANFFFNRVKRLIKRLFGA